MNTEVSTQGQFTQQNIPALLEQVNKEIAKLKKGPGDKTVLINKILPGFGNLSNVNDVQTLIKAYTSVKNKKKFYDEAAKEILDEDTKVPTFKIAGHTASEWKDYIKDKINQAVHKNKITKLEKAKKLLEQNLSAKDKLAKDLAAINEIFKTE